VSKRNRRPTTSPIRAEIKEAVPFIAEKLGMPSGTVVVSRHENRFIDGTPWSMQTSFFPMEFVERGAERLTRPSHLEEGAVQYLADSLGLHQLGYRDWIAVRSPNATETDFFRLP